MSSRISLIVCTRNRGAYLPAMLASVARLEWSPGDELVIVDNGSSDATPEILKSFRSSADFSVVLARQMEPGLSAARNAGLSTATGDFLCFTDDDCYPDSSYLREIRAFFDSSPLGFYGGRVTLHDPNDYPITIQLLETRIELPAKRYVPVGLIHGANFGFSREVAEATGSFDERLGAGSPLKCGEDIDYLLRMVSAGWAGAYEPRICVAHHHRRQSSADIHSLLAGYDLGRGAFFAKSIMASETRALVLWPAFRKIVGNLTRRQFSSLWQELRGAQLFLASRRKGGGDT